MLKYVSKFAMDILPSVIATIIGAYIVNHYIVTRPGPEAPAAAAVASVDPKKADIGNDARPSGTSANLPQPGVKAKGISEKAILEKTAAEKPAVVEKPAETAAEKPAETASIPVETRRHQPAPAREKAVAKSVPAAPAVAAAPVVTAPNTVPAAEAAAAPEERRDANDLARAAIERLRGASEVSPRTQEAARIPDAARILDPPRVVSAPPPASPPVVATPIRPLPPPIMVSTPAAEAFDPATGSTQARPAYPSPTGIGDPNRPTPPADIPMASPSLPASRPLDLRAEATEPLVRDHSTVAEDMLSAAKSVFHAVLPK